MSHALCSGAKATKFNHVRFELSFPITFTGAAIHESFYQHGTTRCFRLGCPKTVRNQKCCQMHRIRLVRSDDPTRILDTAKLIHIRPMQQGAVAQWAEAIIFQPNIPHKNGNCWFTSISMPCRRTSYGLGKVLTSLVPCSSTCASNLCWS